MRPTTQLPTIGIPSALDAPSRSSSNLREKGKKKKMQLSARRCFSFLRANGKARTDSSVRSQKESTGSPLESEGHVRRPNHSNAGMPMVKPKSLLTQVGVGPGCRRWRGLRLPYRIEKGRSHEAHFVHLKRESKSVPAPSLLLAEHEEAVFRVDRSLLTKDGPFVAID